MTLNIQLLPYFIMKSKESRAVVYTYRFTHRYLIPNIIYRLFKGMKTDYSSISSDVATNFVSLLS